MPEPKMSNLIHARGAAARLLLASLLRRLRAMTLIEKVDGDVKRVCALPMLCAWEIQERKRQQTCREARSAMSREAATRWRAFYFHDADA